MKRFRLRFSLKFRLRVRLRFSLRCRLRFQLRFMLSFMVRFRLRFLIATKPDAAHSHNSIRELSGIKLSFTLCKYSYQTD